MPLQELVGEIAKGTLPIQRGKSSTLMISWRLQGCGSKVVVPDPGVYFVVGQYKSMVKVSFNSTSEWGPTMSQRKYPSWI